jgi:hypothetical protein
MRISRSVMSIALCIAAGAVMGIIMGVFLGYLYDSLDVPQTFILIHGLNEIGFALIFGFIGICMGAIVGNFNLHPLWAAALGIAMALAFAVFWLSVEVRVPTEPDHAILIAVFPLLVAMGFFLALIRHALWRNSG